MAKLIKPLLRVKVPEVFTTPFDGDDEVYDFVGNAINDWETLHSLLETKEYTQASEILTGIQEGLNRLQAYINTIPNDGK